MTNLIEEAEGAVVSAAAPYLLWIKLAGALLLAAALFGGGMWLEGQIKGKEIADIKAADAQAQRDAVTTALAKQKKIDQGAQDAAVKEARAQQQIVTRTITILKEVPANVTPAQDQAAAAADRAGCVTYGFYRLLAAGQRGILPDSLALPTGQSVDACTAVEPSALAASLQEILGDGAANAEQLNALLAEIARQKAVLEAPNGAH